MTHSGGKPHHVGDRRQRYEVRYVDADDGIEKVFGWTDETDGGAMVECINLHPVWNSPRVVDRQAKSKEKK